jgi:hypothetical protein
VIASGGSVPLTERRCRVWIRPYTRVWEEARRLAVPTPLRRRSQAGPTDLRHAAVSTWLNGGVAPTQVAEWAGHSVAVLLLVYAKMPQQA